MDHPVTVGDGTNIEKQVFFMVFTNEQFFICLHFF